MEEMIEEYFYNRLDEAVKILDELDSIGLECPTQQSQVDKEISDWLHMLQHQDLGDAELIKIGKKLKELRIKREHLNNVWDLASIYANERGRLIDKGNRVFLMNSMRNKYKNFNQEYNNRILDKDKIEDVLQTKRTRHTIDDELLKRLIDEGKNKKEIQEITGYSMLSINNHLKEIQ